MTIKENEVDAPTVANENIAVIVTRKPNCVVKFDITVKPIAIVAAYAAAVKKVGKEVNIPGFRKGKAPDHFIVDQYASAIDRECVDIALATSYNEAIHLTNIHPLKDSHMKRPVVKECSREKGAHFILEFEARPHVPTVHPEKIELEKIEPVKVTVKACEEALQQLLLHFTTYEPITDRGAEESDFVNLTITLLEDPEKIIADNQRVQLNSKDLPPWLNAKVIGLKPGESGEGLTEQSPTDIIPDFKPIPYRVTVNAISKGILPQLDDELAKKVGVQTIEILKEKIVERLQNEAKAAAYNKQIELLEQKLLEQYPIELPQSYIDEHTQIRFEAYLDELPTENKPKSEHHNRIKKMIEAAAIRDLQLFFLKRKVAEDNKIELTNDDIVQELNRQVALLPSGQSQIDIHADKDHMRERLNNLTFDRKVREFLISGAKVVSSQ